MSSAKIYTALVTGASGFVGQHVVDAFLKQGTRVVVTRRPDAGPLKAGLGPVETVPMDLTSPSVMAVQEQLERDGIQVSCIVNCAAYGVRPQDRDQHEMRRVNVDLPVELVRLAASHGAAMIHLGTSAEYAAPKNATPLDENAPFETTKQYGASKLCGGILAGLEAQARDVQLTTLRLFQVYGPGEAEHRLLPSLIAKLSNAQHVPMSEGTQLRDFVHVSDVVRAIMLVLGQSTGDPTQQVYNVASGSGTSVRDFALTVAKALNADPALLKFGEMPMRPDDVTALVGNPGRINAATGWKPEHTHASGVENAVQAILGGTREMCA